MKDGEEVFVGRILAGMTHELLNVFATINEAAGLLDDLLALRDTPSHPGHDRAQRSLQRIRHQVKRGTELCERLNRFAHSMDEPISRVAVDEILDQLVFLMQRFARLRRVTLQAEPMQSSPAISTRPLQLQLTLAACIDHCIECAGANGTVTLQALESDTATVIRIEVDSQLAGDDQRLAANEQMSALTAVLAGLGATIAPLQSPGRKGLELLLPRH
jgi:C4-dicarboxylate-specific signal transduction histidine kinase